MDTVPTEKLSARVRTVREHQRLPSLVVAIGSNGTVLTSASAGLADIDADQHATETTPYRIGSITKTFTATLVLLLARDGRLDLDDPIGRFFPGTVFARVPIWRLLAHIGGVQREAPVDMWESMRGPAREELLAAFGDVEMVAEPGQRMHYSNLGYAILGQIIEAVTDQRCPELINTRLLEPLALDSTTWTRPTRAAVGYRRDPYADLFHPEPDMDQATVGVGGQLWSTVDDLLGWGHALAGGAQQIVPVQVTNAMHTMRVMVDTENWTRGWGLGLMLNRLDDRIVSGHTGAMPGFLAGLSIDRSTRAVVAALTNVTRGITIGDLTDSLVLTVAGDDQTDPTPRWEPADLCPDELRDILGTWWSESDETVFTWRADGLHAHLAASPHTTDTRFRSEGPARYRAAAGRLEGERLTIEDRDGQRMLYWGTYPFNRRPQ